MTEINNSSGLRETIAVRAYELYQLRGGQPGLEVDDWLQAERDVLTAVVTEGETGVAAAATAVAPLPEPPRKRAKSTTTTGGGRKTKK